MSEFMRAIVQEVLRPAEQPERPPKKKKEPPAVQQKLHRPNYQNAMREKRLNELKGNHEKISNPGDELVSRLNILTLAQGAERGTTVPANHGTKNTSGQPCGRLIGSAPSGLAAWLYSNLPHEKLEWFHRPISARGVAVFSAPVSSPGQLVILQEELTRTGGVKYFIQWDKNGKKAFLLELFHNDCNLLETTAENVWQALNRQTKKKTKLFYLEQPGSWLLNQLELTGIRGAVAIMEGFGRYESYSLLLPVLQELASINIRYKIEESYLVLYGAHEQLASYLPGLFGEIQQ
ncbi:hypothetical protein SAMN04488137_0748 [Fictibacillus solisalsi]|uniref:Uncharacterized protein n=1 Tax=Fictibacillus solisalsi TaxID=459525 RepID=A0A1G9U785_9BACL|nr:hypothetical protein [Fictibacillus solisalsi]SDM55829.1 hypothetical protein SAMN04488137_0748 [Fictibacillus solisalsi]